MAPSDPNEPPAKKEPRAIDVVRAVGSQRTDDELDPQTIAQLAAWFSAPTPKPRSETADEKERREYLERQQRAIDAVDPAFYQRRLEIEKAGMRLYGKHPPPPPVNPINSLDVERWHLPTADAGRREIDIPEMLRDDLRICTPQALLRDLFRVVSFYEKMFAVAIEDQQAADALRDQVHGKLAFAGEVMRTSYYIGPKGPSVVEMMRDDLDEFRAAIDAPWEKAAKIRRRNLTSEEAQAAARWFMRRR